MGEVTIVPFVYNPAFEELAERWGRIESQRIAAIAAWNREMARRDFFNLATIAPELPQKATMVQCWI